MSSLTVTDNSKITAYSQLHRQLLQMGLEQARGEAAKFWEKWEDAKNGMETSQVETRIATEAAFKIMLENMSRINVGSDNEWTLLTGLIIKLYTSSVDYKMHKEQEGQFKNYYIQAVSKCFEPEKQLVSAISDQSFNRNDPALSAQLNNSNYNTILATNSVGQNNVATANVRSEANANSNTVNSSSLEGKSNLASSTINKRKSAFKKLDSISSNHYSGSVNHHAVSNDNDNPSIKKRKRRP